MPPENSKIKIKKKNHMYEVHKGIAYLLIFGQYNCHVEGEECVIYTMTVRADWQTEQN